MALWPDFCGSDSLLTQRIAGIVTALAAAALPGLPGGFLACVATADGALHRVQAEPRGGGRLEASVRRLPVAAAPQAASQQVSACLFR